jgi:hypothetical protein
MTLGNESAVWREPDGAGQATARKRGTDTSTRRIPHKWQRILAALLERSLNRWEAERELSDHCLHSTVSTIQSKGVRVERKTEKTPGYMGIPTEVCRYWLDENVKPVARELLKGANV